MAGLGRSCRRGDRYLFERIGSIDLYEPEQTETISGNQAEYEEREAGIVAPDVSFSGCLKEKEACATEKNGEREGGSYVKNEGTENEQEKKDAAEDEAGVFFSEENRKSENMVLSVPVYILEVFEWERDGVGEEEEEEK